MSGRRGSGVEFTLGFPPSCVQLKTYADAVRKARVFVPSGLIGVKQSSDIKLVLKIDRV